LHHLANVLDIETSAVESAVVRRSRQDFADGLYSALARGVGALHHQSRGTHADNHAVPAAVERNGGVRDHFVGGRRSAGQEASAHPIDEMVRGYVVGRDDNHTAAAPGVDPVLRQRDTLCGARTGSVDLSVGTASADEFGELRMSHGQDSEQKAPVEDVWFLVDGGAQFVDALLDLLNQTGVSICLDFTCEQ